MFNLSRYIVLAVLFFWTFRCSNNPAITGGGLDTESSGGKLVGSVSFSDGQAGKNTKVTLLPHKYLPFIPDSLKTTITDSFGIYEFKDIDSGSYNISAVSLDSGYRFFQRDISVKKNDSIKTDPGILRIPGTITLSFEGSMAGGFVYIPGTTILKQISETPENQVVIDSVPAEAEVSVFYRKNAGSNDSLLAQNITLSPGAVYNIYNISAWSYSRQIRLNTSESGLHTDSDLYSIPVLLRLSASNFNFSEVQESGADIRFIKSNGSRLHFEIERWDSQNDSGEIWVNVDTLYANDSSQSFLMLWGNSDSLIESDTVLTFDTAYGFTGVWHIDGEKDGIRNRDVYKDATYYRNHGDDYIHARGIDGIAGYGKQFNGKDDYIFIEDNEAYHVGSDPFTVSLWFNKSSQKNGILLLYKYTEDETKEFAIATDTNSSVFVYTSDSELFDTLCQTTPVMLNVWHFITFTRSESGKIELFLDGEQADDTLYSLDISNAEVGSGIFIGSNIDPESEPFDVFDGFIDEVRFESVARTKEWIRLVYDNVIQNDYNNNFISHNEN